MQKYKRTHITVFEVTKRHIGLNLTKRIPTVKAQIEIYTDTQRQVYFIFLIIKKTPSPRGILGPTALYIPKIPLLPFTSLSHAPHTPTHKEDHTQSHTHTHTLSLSLSLSNQRKPCLLCKIELSNFADLSKCFYCPEFIFLPYFALILQCLDSAPTRSSWEKWQGGDHEVYS